MKKIEAPSELIQKLLFDTTNASAAENMQNIEKWIKLINAPFEKFPTNMIVETFKTWESKQHDLTDFKDLPEILVRFVFPGLASAILTGEGGWDNVICIDFEYGNKADMYTCNSEPFIQTKNGFVKRIDGTWEEVVTAYLDFMKRLTTVPTPIAN